MKQFKFKFYKIVIMDGVSRRSVKSSKKGGNTSRRSRSLTPRPAGSKKSTRSQKSRKSTGKYSKLRHEETEIEMVDLNDINFGNPGQSKIGAAAELRPHDIYENT